MRTLCVKVPGTGKNAEQPYKVLQNEGGKKKAPTPEGKGLELLHLRTREESSKG